MTVFVEILVRNHESSWLYVIVQFLCTRDFERHDQEKTEQEIQQVLEIRRIILRVTCSTAFMCIVSNRAREIDVSSVHV
jgi:hypothetical protein